MYEISTTHLLYERHTESCVGLPRRNCLCTSFHVEKIDNYTSLEETVAVWTRISLTVFAR